jgi:hypothetical protein
MIFLCAVVIGIAVGYMLGGRLSRLVFLRLRGVWLVLVALGIQLLIFPLFTPNPIIPFGTAILHGVSYGLVLLWLLLNVHTRPLIAVGGGALLNIAVVALNAGYMPASSAAFERAGLLSVAKILARGETYGNLVGMSATTRLNVLGDRIGLPRGVPFATVMSVGDVLIMVGLAWLLAKGMKTDA